MDADKKMSRKTILVTGGCGFVGRNLIKNLLTKEHTIWIIDDLSVGLHPDSWLPAGYKTPRLTDSQGRTVYEYPNDQTIYMIHEDAISFFYNQTYGSLRKPMDLPFFDEVYHLASIVGGRALIEGDPIKVAVDLAIDSIFFLWLTRNPKQVGGVLYASSSAIYPVHLQGEEGHVALKEEYIQFNENLGMPDLTYGWSKLTGELLARITAEKYNISIACIRPFSGYGEDQDLTYPVPSIENRIAKREDPVEVWSTGKQGRDFIHINDVIEAMQLILQKVSDGSGINVGSGKLYSFSELIKLSADIAGYTPEIKPLLDKPVGVQSRYADISRMKEVLGWEPKISLKEGLTRVLRYREEQLKKEYEGK